MKILAAYALEEERIALPAIYNKEREQDEPLGDIKQPSGLQDERCGSEAHEIVEVVVGVGKTQAAGGLALAIAEHKPHRVLNIGTVGTYRHNVGDILVCRHFIDRDMHRLPLVKSCREIDMSGLSYAHDLRSVIRGVASDRTITVNTGDNFVMSAEEDLGCDAVDMEAFAMAWVCQKCGIPFLSVKYVTDILGQNSVELWADKLENARKDLQAYFAPVTGNLFR